MSSVINNNRRHCHQSQCIIGVAHRGRRGRPAINCACLYLQWGCLCYVCRSRSGISYSLCIKRANQADTMKEQR